jgi:DNA mismatch repair protein MutH
MVSSVTEARRSRLPEGAAGARGWGGMGDEFSERYPSGANAPADSDVLSYGLKPVPFNLRPSPFELKFACFDTISSSSERLVRRALEDSS